ncbi:amidohydrolase [Lacticaseibacillus baoqingensis]|uniref:Amidohydrolase n=1 Tax=Lacticaseibacillus baoqingensis TaxID=2486013 RepID=A0ABW4E9Y8_9LACO|nr:amidohydrolase [Lacticaseibacillus baoqingensis]
MSIAEHIPAQIHTWQPELVALRHELHQHPEIGLHETRTAQLVAAKLQAWGYTVTTGIGGTGVVGQLCAGDSRKTLGLRADMDCLPLTEKTGLPYASQTPGLMHACGHDGHIATMLMTARYLAATKLFDGTVNVIFQPGEEGVHGASKMIADGLFDRFPCDMVFGYHNWPHLPDGTIHLQPGPVMASSDRVRLTIQGRGGHASAPERTVDPIVVGAALVNSLQTIVARNVAPLNAAVVTIGSFIAGQAETYNVIPDTATLYLSIRTLDKQVREAVLARIQALAAGIGAAYGANIECENFQISLPVVNAPAPTALAQAVATQLFGPDKTCTDFEPVMASEDFSFMLDRVPGCFALMSGGAKRHYVHTSRYDFDDALIAPMATYFATIVETYLQAPSR